jgi:hypothetical protein
MPHVERELRVDIASEGDAFAPPLHVVRPGDEVQFVNRGALVHRLFIADVDGRSERAVNPGGASAAFEITRAGEHRFYCSLHPHESFTVFASPSDQFVVPDGGSSYRFDDLPAGRYRLRWWSEAGLRSLGSVEIREGETETRAISLGEAPQ